MRLTETLKDDKGLHAESTIDRHLVQLVVFGSSAKDSKAAEA